MDREKVIKGLEQIVNDPFMKARADYWVLVCSEAIALLKEQEEEIENLKQTCQSMMEGVCLLKEQEAATEYIIDEYQPTCKACGFRPFAGYIPTLEWMRERGFKFCPKCGRAVKWE